MHDELFKNLRINKDRKETYNIRMSDVSWFLSLFMVVFNTQLATYFIGVAIFLRIVENEE